MIVRLLRTYASVAKCLSAVVVLVLSLAGTQPGLAENGQGGLILSWEPADADIAKAATIDRAGTALVPALLMALEQEDVVIVNDPDVRLHVETAAGEQSAGGPNPRLTITGDLNVGTEAQGLIGRLAKALASAPAVGTADGKVLAMPMAKDGQNFVTPEGGPVHLGWSGGEAPYSLIFDINGRRKELATTREQSIDFDIPKEATNRFSVIVKDRARKRVRVDFHMRKQTATVPDAILSAPGSPRFKAMLETAWLAQRLNGMWRIHTIRLLRNGDSEQSFEARFTAFLEAGGMF